MVKTYCKGQHCPVKSACERFVSRNDAGSGDGIISCCTNQKKFIKV